MARRSRRTDRRRNDRAAGAEPAAPTRSGRRNGDGNGRATARSGGGLGPVFIVMSVIVLAVIAGGFAMSAGWFGETEPPKPPPPRVDVIVKSDPRTRFLDHPPVPWSGTIGGKTGTVRIGMSDQQVVAQFGDGKLDELYGDNPYRKRFYYDEPAGTGMMRETGGVALIVFIDIDSGKVFGFIPPQATPQTAPQ